MDGRMDGATHARTEPQQRYYIPTTTRCAGIINTDEGYYNTVLKVKMIIKIYNHVKDSYPFVLSPVWRKRISFCVHSRTSASAEIKID